MGFQRTNRTKDSQVVDRPEQSRPTFNTTPFSVEEKELFSSNVYADIWQQAISGPFATAQSAKATYLSPLDNKPIAIGQFEQRADISNQIKPCRPVLAA